MSSQTKSSDADSPEGRPQQDHAGASAGSPQQIPPRGWWNVLKRTASGFSQDRIMAEAASVTFYGLLALFPAIAAFISIYGLITNPATLNDQLSSLSGVVPGGGLDLVKGQISALTSKGHGTLGFAAIIGVVISLWSANSGIKSLFDALNVVYHEREKRGFVRLTMISLAFTLGGICFVILALLSIVAIPIVLKFIGLGGIYKMLINVLRWPCMLAVIVFALAFIYRYGPSRTPARWQWVSWGGGFAAVCWLLVSYLFSYYVGHFGNYNKTYGSLGAVAGFMTWIWISTMVVLMGAELNAELEQQTDRDSTVGPEKPMGRRGAYKADVKA